MLELAKFAKHHIPEEHELDDQADYNSFHNHPLETDFIKGI